MIFHSLLQGRRWSMKVLVAMTLCSAVAMSSFTNIVAYEAFAEAQDKSTVSTLRTLQDPMLDDTKNPYVIIYESMDPSLANNSVNDFVFNLSSTQQYQFTEQMSDMLNNLGISNSTLSLDSSGAYIGYNATALSLDAVDADVVTLQAAPVYTINATCTPATLKQDLNCTEYGDVVTNQTQLGWYGSWYTAADPTPRNFQYWAASSAMALEAYATMPIMAFSASEPSVVLAFYLDYDPINGQVVPSPLGDVQPYINSSEPDSAFLVWSVLCTLDQQEGTMDLTRSATTEQGWTSSSSPLFQDPATDLWSLLWSFMNVGNFEDITDPRWTYQAPSSDEPGIAAAVAGHLASLNVTACQRAGGTSIADTAGSCIDFGLFRDHLVYATAQAKSIVYNMAAQNADADPAAYHYAVAGSVRRQFYRITYVAVLLLAGLLSTLCAASLAGGMVLGMWPTLSWRRFRQVDTLRLVVDSVAGLDRAEMAPLGSRSDGVIEDWANGVCVQYMQVKESDEEDGADAVVIRLVASRAESKAG